MEEEEEDAARVGEEDDDLAELGGLVQARAADAVEQEICDRFTGHFEQPSTSTEGQSECNQQTNGTSGGIDGLLGLHGSIKQGDLTPLEFIASQKKQSEQKKRDEVKQEETEDEEEEEGGEIEKNSDDEWKPENERPSTSRRRPSSNSAQSDAGFSEDDSDNYEPDAEPAKKKPRTSKTPKKEKKVSVYLDDGDDKAFEARLRKCLARKELDRLEREGTSTITGSNDEYRVIKNDLRVSASIWARLYKYQKTGIRWMAELCEQRVGGILADEMGLGKTIQTAVFLRAIAESQRRDNLLGYTGLGPSLLVCPATLLQQWVREMHEWHPLCRVSVLHSCGSHKGRVSELLKKALVVRRSGSMLITTYATFYKEKKRLAALNWHYVILDEGHKIRNPEARGTLALKEVRTPYRLLLSGSPMQNSLRELWSLVDFVYPGRLGSLKTFMEKFSVPITIGGYANATPTQTETAYKCAVVLRDAINAYFLRRMKKDVQMTLDLPGKSEQMLFCDLTPVQRSFYLEYLSSHECCSIQAGRLDAFTGLMLLRKLCNHPDLVTGGPNRHGDADLVRHPEQAYGWPERSGKAQVVRSLLQLWRRQNEKKAKKEPTEGEELRERGERLTPHKVLLFSQSRAMLTILETMLVVDGHSYLRMDGTTNIAKRQQIVQQFNEDPSIFVFLLTTRVGGVGVNLTAANKVVIFDPDWNPSTDAQARERAWRIGQNREVTVYRLIATGTIEEKMYHRQIFKLFLANRVLKDPKQRRFFKTNHLHDLFTLTDNDKGGATDTGAIFCGETDELTKKNFFDRHLAEREKARKERKKAKKEEQQQIDEEEEEEDEDIVEHALTEDRREQLRRIAAEMSKNIEAIVPVTRKKRKSHEEGEVKEERKDEEKGVFEHKYLIPYLRKEKKMKRSKQERDDDKDTKLSSSSDDYILGKLLSKDGGVRSIVRHDDVVGDGNKSKRNRDSHLEEREADAVARQAAAAIRKRPRLTFFQRKGIPVPSAASEASTSSSPSFGSGGALTEKKKEGDLMAVLRARKARQEGGAEQPLPEGNRFTVLAEKIKDFLRLQWGASSTSQRITERFKKEVSHKDLLHFRSILNQIATFDRSTLEWTLKEEFN